MVRRHTIAQPHAHIKGRLVVHGLESSLHTRQFTMARPSESPTLSDRLLVTILLLVASQEGALASRVGASYRIATGSPLRRTPLINPRRRSCASAARSSPQIRTLCKVRT